MSNGTKSGESGCLKVAGIGCGIVILLSIIAALVAYSNRDKILSMASGWGLEKGADVMFDSLNLPAEEKAAAMVHVRDLSARIRRGDITLEQATEILESLADGPLPTVMTLRYFEARYGKGTSLSEVEKQEAHVTVTRFAQGLINKAIDPGKSDEIGAIITETTIDASGNEVKKLKETISDSELKKCLKIMKDAADAAGVANREFKVDIAGEMRKAIDKGLSEVQSAEKRPVK